MQVKSIRKTPGSTQKVVTLSHVTEVNDEAVLEAALSATRETRSSIFGSNVTYYMDDESEMSAAVVTLWID